MYKVIAKFDDLEDEGYSYNVGDIYPRDGLKVTKKRCRELAGRDNLRGVQLIEEIVTKDTPDEDSEEQED